MRHVCAGSRLIACLAVALGSALLLGAAGASAQSTPTLSIADARVLEGNSGTAQLGFRVSLSAPSPGNVSFNLTTSDGGAFAPSDYSALVGWPATIPAGQISVVVNVPVIGDSTIEVNETLFASVDDVVGAAVPGDLDAVGQVLNDDGNVLASVPAEPLDLNANDDSYGPMITPDGRYVVFHSRAGDLSHPLDRVQYDVYLRDTVAGTTTLVSRNVNGGRGTWESSRPSVSDGGRYVAFVSYARDLVPNDTNGFADVFRRDMQTGTTELVTMPANGVGGANDNTFVAVMSGDGNHVAFLSEASNLLANDPNGGGRDIMIRNMQSGVTTWASPPYTPGGSNIPNEVTGISRDGRYIVFSSPWGNFVANDPSCPIGPDAPACSKAYWRDTVAGITKMVNLDPNGVEPFPTLNVATSVSADGRWVGFVSNTFDANGMLDVFVRDTSTDNTRVASIGPGAQLGNGPSSGGRISPDGTHIAYFSKASNLVANDTNGVTDAFVRRIGGTSNVRVGMAVSGDQANGDTMPTSISDGARFIAMYSAASNLVLADANGVYDVVVAGNPGKPSDDADLASLVPSPGGLSPAFSPATTSYSMSVIANSIRFTPVVHQPGSTVTVNGVGVTSGNASPLIALAYGINKISVVVMAADKVTKKTTNIDVRRENVSFPVLSIADASTTEGNAGTKQLSFTVTLSAPAAGVVGFSLATANSNAVSGTDYLGLQLVGQTIPAGTTTKSFSVSVKGDTAIEPDESFFVDVIGVSGAAVGDARGVGTIINDDGGDGPVLDIGDAFVQEGELGNYFDMTFKVTLSKPSTVPVSFDVVTLDGTATMQNFNLFGDYKGKSSFGTTIPAGATSVDFTVTVAGDSEVEGNERFQVKVSNVSGALRGDVQALGTIVDDDGSPYTFSIGDISIPEGNSGSKFAELTATLATPTDVPVSFDVMTQVGTAGDGSDFVWTTLSNLQIPVGSTSTTFPIEILGDTVVEGDETFKVWAQNLSGVLAADPTATITILEDDAPRLPVLSVDDVRIMEGNNGHPLATFTVTLSAPSPNPVSFSFATTDDSATSPTDFAPKSLTGLVIPAGSTTKRVAVSINGDNQIEPDESFEVNVTDVVGATVARGSARAEVLNDDAVGSETGLSVGDVSISEGDSSTKTLKLSVELGIARDSATFFDIATSNGSATAGSDYVASSLVQQEIPAGATSKEFAITIKGDTIKEPDETILVTLSNNVGSYLSDSEAIATIVDEEGGGANVTPELSIADVSVSEGHAGSRTANLIVSLSAASISPVSFDLDLANATAMGGSDYSGVALTGVTIPAGQTSKTIPVNVFGDMTNEADETFTAIVSGVAGATVTDSLAIATIVNDDGITIPTLSIADVSATEGALGYSSMTVTVSLSGPAPSSIAFDIAAIDGTAQAGYDFAYFSLTGQTIEAGQTNKTFSIGILGDEYREANETFNVNVTNVAGAMVADGSAIGTILNDDGATLPVMSISDGKLFEGNFGVKWMYFTVSLSFPSSDSISFPIYSIDGTAIANEDYGPLGYQGGVFPPGETVMIASIPIFGDTTFEWDENFIIKLDSVFISGAAVSKDTGVGTIFNDDVDDPSPALSINDVSITEGNSGTKTATFTLSLSEPAISTVSFDVATSNGTATPGADFVSNSAVGQAIPAGQTSANFAVTINGDVEREVNETFTVNLNNVTGATLADGQGLGTIVNDDDATLSISDVSIAEGDSGIKTATFVLSLSRPLPTPVTFDIFTKNGSALAGSDYMARSQVGKVLDAGRTRVLFEVTVLGDTTMEPTETFDVVISNVSGATVGDGTAVATIQNDDSALLPISTIQGSGVVSPLQGSEVSTSGVVTAVTNAGFFIQSEPGQDDGDPMTSEALFVASDDANVRLGSRVRVRGRVEEAQVGNSPDQLTLTRILAHEVATSDGDAALPAAITITAGDARTDGSPTQLERLEGMRVAVPEMRVVGPAGGVVDERRGTVRPNGRFYGVVKGVARPFREPGLNVLDRARGQAGVDVPLFDSNPERLLVNTVDQRGSTAVSADTGDTIVGLVGVLAYGDGAYQVLPDASAPLTVRSGAEPRSVSMRTPQQATIGSFHLRRFLDDQPGSNEPVVNADAYAIRLAKAANAICAYTRSPDVLAVSGAEGKAALSDLAGALNARDGNLLFPASCSGDVEYEAVLRPTPGKGDVGFLVRQHEVRPGVSRIEVQSVSAAAGAETFLNRDGTREPLHDVVPSLLRARINDNAAASVEITVMAVAVVALDGELNAPGAHGWLTRGEYLRAKRSAQALSLARTIQTRQRTLPREKLVVLGNMESNEFSDGHADLLGILTGREALPQHVLRHAGSPVNPPLTNLMLSVPRPDRYTVSRDGNAEAVDHILLSRLLVQPAYNARMEIAHIDADFGEDNFSDTGVPVRVSDHDPVVLFLNLPARP